MIGALSLCLGSFPPPSFFQSAPVPCPSVISPRSFLAASRGLFICQAFLSFLTKKSARAREEPGACGEERPRYYSELRRESARSFRGASFLPFLFFFFPARRNAGGFAWRARALSLAGPSIMGDSAIDPAWG